jgi:isopenicillin N synthase-like dioxygenase
MSNDFIPVIDLSLGRPVDLAEILAGVCRNSGFFVITGHGVPAPVVENMYANLRQFFVQPVAEKMTVAAGLDDPLLRGFIPGERHEQFYLNRLGELSDREQASLDERLRGPNRWPDVSGLRAAALEYYAAMERLAGRLAGLFAISLGLDHDWFVPFFDRHMSPLVGNYYPPQPTPPPVGSLRNPQHRDWCAFTVLYQDDAPGGLQVLDHNEQWVDVAAVPGSFVVNLGRIMARWTDNRWASTVHRVVNPDPEYAHRDRISVPFFYHPNPDQSLDLSTGTRARDGDGETAGAFHIRMADSARERKRLPALSAAHTSSGVPGEFAPSSIGGI